ncbi:MAG: hypothetical protein KGL39_13730 [Patescibacteria group bacterium]|nr:hypothetical protein [Patescibacteria group bacterium]
MTTKPRMNWKWVREVGDKWLNIAMSAAEPNWNDATVAIKELYRINGLNPPVKVIEVQSPMQGELVCAALEYMQSGSGNPWYAFRSERPMRMRGAIWQSIARHRSVNPNDFWRQVQRHLYADAWNEMTKTWVSDIHSQMEMELETVVHADVLMAARNKLNGALLRKRLDKIVGLQNFSPPYSFATFGQFDASLMAECEVALTLTHETNATFEAMKALTQSCGWCWPTTHAAVICRRMTAVNFDDKGALHDDSGPALEYGDGWGVWAWHGVQVPSHVIQRPHEITSRMIAWEPREDVRLVMVDRMESHR